MMILLVLASALAAPEWDNCMKWEMTKGVVAHREIGEVTTGAVRTCASLEPGLREWFNQRTSQTTLGDDLTDEDITERYSDFRARYIAQMMVAASAVQGTENKAPQR
jgi:hypothetical protein